MIELAPNWKRSLTIANPLILAGGGFAPEQFSDTMNAGAFITLPLTQRSHSGTPPPHVVEITSGALIRTGAANPGLVTALRDYRRVWAKAAIPIIVAFASQSIRDWAEMAMQLDRVEGVSAIELHFNPLIDAADAIRAVRPQTELPILAKLDLDNARDIAAACMAAGANALVIGRAPRAMRMVDGKPWFARLYSPSVKPIALRAMADVAQMNLSAPIIACGGVHSAEDVQEFIAAGATAVQVDSAVWVGVEIGRLKE